MTPEEIEAIVGGYHGDAFRILGPHATTKRGKKSLWEVRAFLPDAESASVLIGDTITPLEKRHDGGFFCVQLTGKPEKYLLRVTSLDGTTADVEDPYRFPPLLTDYELHLHGEGTNFEAYRTMGAHLVELDGVSGVRFAVWAPNAANVTVTGDFNHWNTRMHPMRLRTAGIWEMFIPNLAEGATYKYNIRSKMDGIEQLKADPYGFEAEVPPQTASVVWDIDKYEWQDADWMERRAHKEWLKAPVSVYELHVESWLRGPMGKFLTYRELAVQLVEYIKKMGYTHIELLPIMEHPFSGSWGYQVIGYFAPTSRFGTPEDFMYFVDKCHEANIGVIIDWVPAHFPRDAHGLRLFDGTALYEHADPRRGEHRDWGTMIFNYGRHEVRTFLISNALFWLKKYHIDGLRVDAVASMIYLDYSREPGDWIPNEYGGRENLEALDFLRKFNMLAHEVPGAMTIAEESTSFPGVSRPVYLNGLGFTMKWNMGWMHDMFNYFKQDPVYRKFHHNNITFSLMYAFAENFMLPISHDEVVHMKNSLINKMPGDEWKQFANVRAFLAYMYGHPGKKLLFMGQEIGQHDEWNHNASIQWELLSFDYHRKLQFLVQELNRIYRENPALYEVDFNYKGFEWIDFRDVEHSAISFLRRAEDPRDFVVFCCNFTPVVRYDYAIGVPEAGVYDEILNTDSHLFGGSNVGNGGSVTAQPSRRHDRPYSIYITLPPLAVVAFKKR